MWHAVKGACVALSLMCATPVIGQQAAPIANPILTIDSERMFLNSDFGKRVAREIEQRGNELAAENRLIEAELAKAEQDLTDRRATMTAADFRPLAIAFDARVQETRRAQAAKTRALNDLLGQEREVFLGAAGPVLQALMFEVGATVVLERRTVFISTNASDITGRAIERINATLGEEAVKPPTGQEAAPQDTQAPVSQD